MRKILLVLITLWTVLSRISCAPLDHGAPLDQVALVTSDGAYREIQTPQDCDFPLQASHVSRIKRTVDKHELKSIKTRERRAAVESKKKKATEQLVDVVKDMMEQVPLVKRPAVRNALREVEKDLNNNKSGSDAKARDMETQIRRPPVPPPTLLPTQPPSAAIAQKLKVKRVENQLQLVQKAYDKEKEKSAARSKSKINKLKLH